MRPGRHVIVTNDDNFPTDVYIAEGLCALLGANYKLRFASPAHIERALDHDVVAVSFSHVDYKSARIEDMAAITAKVHAAGALAIWDLSLQRRCGAGRSQRRSRRFRGRVRI